MGIDLHLSKPVMHSDLLDALTAIFGGGAARPAGTGRRVPTVAPGPLRVLVAEDNPVNRQLVTQVLQKRGHRVTGVENGRAAVESVASGGDGPFDAVLMDLQMPQMGGLEATRAIRTAERAGGRHVPIIALTAHAMPGDRERCLAAGMDGYLSKPIDVDELVATLETIVAGAVPPSGDGAAASPRGGAVFDERAALACTGGDRTLLREVVALFRADAPAALRRMRRALRAADGEALRAAAHTLKGSLAVVGSAAGRDAAAELERLGRSGRLDHAEASLAALRRQLGLLDQALEEAGLTPGSRRRAPSGQASRARSAGRSRKHEQDTRR
jgi:CheY-like chemotaxis protein/HPt (histidine-containing phosphotransfer) domain-containing protein